MRSKVSNWELVSALMLVHQNYSEIFSFIKGNFFMHCFQVPLIFCAWNNNINQSPGLKIWLVFVVVQRMLKFILHPKWRSEYTKENELTAKSIEWDFMGNIHASTVTEFLLLNDWIRSDIEVFHQFKTFDTWWREKHNKEDLTRIWYQTRRR